ncbi:vacuolar protein sorting/targeting protein PEP1 [Pseudomassariella vexata]|uniref:Vacuolar protein sorting/targeting protein 10 n=1 Tax=Pseudomassariella vexata TaxID=1141098 RepID=A0A1Y2DBQ1_9PEZI|nr:vacuolar protein sorting/targeting protein PEP1 [Pseudomassariella vexata]ORY56692.1 vacuolar protein sorting/targeting protein PEP1 [Pseudomassariella vexata]
MISKTEAKNTPDVKATDFEHFPTNLNYFQDSDVVLFQDLNAGAIWRSPDAGATWAKVDEIDKAFVLIMHQYDSNRAYVLTKGVTHWRTHDRGKTWHTFFTDAELSIFRGDWLIFHATDPDRILFNGMDCQSIFCDEVVMYTTDGFESDAKFLRGNTAGCWWAKSSDLFSTGSEDLDSQRILCIVRGSFSLFKEDNQLLISDNYFSATAESGGEVQEFEPDLNGFSSVQGVVNMAVVKKYLLVATASKNTDEMALYVTDDTLKWHRAEFPSDHRLVQEAYTVLEGTNYSIQVDVMTARPSNPMGVMLTSNSNGTYFTRNMEHTNRNIMGHVDFEKISGIQGIFLVNQVDNFEAVEKDPAATKKIKTKITFDDGRSFEAVRAGDKEIHLHSVTELNNVGRVFSSPAPGLVMGNGNVGDYLGPFNEANLYVSDDAGRTWIKGLDGPHKYEFGDQGSILLAVRDRKDKVGEVKYSLDHGKNWATVELPDGLKITPWVLTTTQDSTSLKFVLTGESGSSENPKFHVISIDFEGLHEATCTESDMEEWNARVDDEGKPSCIMGHTQMYHRRKKDAKCFIKQEFKDPVPETSRCECADADFECDFNFVRNGDKCELKGLPIVPEGQKCKNQDDTFMGSSGWRLIPGNQCKRKDGEQKDKEREWKCSEVISPPADPASGNIAHNQHPIKGNYDYFEKHYLERGESSTEKDETIIMRPVKRTAGGLGGMPGDIQITHDHGVNWESPKVLKDQKIWGIVTHPYIKDMVFFVQPDGKVFYSVDRGRHFDSFKAPDPVGDLRRNPLAFHPDRRDWLIWHGKRCPEGSSADSTACYGVASYSSDRGDNWHTLKRYSEKCEFTGSSAYKDRKPNSILCLANTREDNDGDNPLQLSFSADIQVEKLEAKLDNVKDFATMAEFIVVATENKTASTLNALTSIDGEKYAAAHFPYNFEVPHQHAYTVLDSSTHAINLFVSTETNENRRYGSIMKSNSNGTSYVTSLSNANCDNNYYVDFEKMLGLQGVVLVNIVENRDSDDPKRLQTKISHNDGAEWAFLPPPKADVDGKAFSCRGGNGDEGCALHLHGYTERDDHRKTYSSESAVGIMLGWGNVGPILGESKEADTFMTTDAGISWKMVKKGRWVWSFGDQGSIIVLAQRETQTKTISYTLDEGNSWKDYQFSDTEVSINDVTTLRSGASRNFLLWGHKGDEVFTVNVDFSGLTDQHCKVDADNEDKSDYKLWTPKHPKQPNGCLFGHNTYYLRKKTDRTCFNSEKLNHVYKNDNCTCTRQDFECAYNYEMDNHGQCVLVKGLQPVSMEQYCKENPSKIEYYQPSGFRKIPLTTCQGGEELDKIGEPVVCPGHEEEFEKAHRVSGVAIFFAVVIPIGLAAAAGWWVWRNWQNNFGQIRLGEQHTIDSETLWVKYPVIAVSAMVAVISALPLVAAAVWRSASDLVEKFTGRSAGRYSWLGGSGPRRFTTRDSFARGRADYDIVDEDEGELLGDDSDEEV